MQTLRRRIPTNCIRYIHYNTTPLRKQCHEKEKPKVEEAEQCNVAPEKEPVCATVGPQNTPWLWPIPLVPHWAQKIGPKHVSILKAFVPALIVYGLASFLAIIYIADWKAVLQYLPFYNGKYAVEEKRPPAKEKQVEVGEAGGEGEGEGEAVEGGEAGDGEPAVEQAIEGEGDEDDKRDCKPFKY